MNIQLDRRQHRRQTGRPPLLRLAVIGGPAAAALLLAGCSLSPARDAAASGPAAPGIAGTWIVTVTPTGPIAPFQSTIVFTRDGAVVEATTKAVSAPTTDTSEGLGAWSAAGDSVHMTFQKYLFDGQGHYIGRTVIVETDTLDHQGEAYSGKATTTVYAPNGTVVASFPSTSTAVRMAV